MASSFIMPGKIVSGRGALEQAEADLGRLGSRALVVTDGAMVRIGALERVTRALDRAGLDYRVYDGVGGEPTGAMVAQGLSAYRDGGCDCLVALGGGSPMDAMKAIGALAVHGGELRALMGREIGGPLPPMAAIPTTAGTGSEATRFTIITDTENDVKMLLKGDALMPDLAVVDPQFTMTAPPSITAATGLDALTHAVEAYTSKRAQPLTDGFALSAVRRIFRSLPAAFHDGGDEGAREELSLAALEAGIAFNNSSVTIVHGMSRPIGALFHVPHGISNAMLLKACLTFALDGAYERFADLADTIGVGDPGADSAERARAFLRAVEALCRELEIPTLAEHGIDRAAFFARMDKMAEDALISGSPANTRREVTKADILRIYEELWK